MNWLKKLNLWINGTKPAEPEEDKYTIGSSWYLHDESEEPEHFSIVEEFKEGWVRYSTHSTNPFNRLGRGGESSMPLSKFKRLYSHRRNI